MILHQGAGDMDNRYFPGTDLETMPDLELAAASNHGILASKASTSSWSGGVWRMPTPVWPGWQHSRKGGTAGKADNLRAAFFWRGAGYEPHEHV